MENLNYKRFFAFGCSFTDYRWPTWADIIGQSFGENYYNFGISAASNQMILRSIVEANLLYKFTNNDLVIIMWTDILRDEIYTPWQFSGTGGNILTKQSFSNERELNKFLLDYFVRDMLNVQTAVDVLNSTGVNYQMTSIVPITMSEGSLKITAPDRILELFSDLLEKIKPSVFEVIFKNNWNTYPPVKFIDNSELVEDTHPSTRLHYNFVKYTWPDIQLADNIEEYVDHYENILESVFNTKEQGHIHNKKFTKRLYP